MFSLSAYQKAWLFAISSSLALLAGIACIFVSGTSWPIFAVLSGGFAVVVVGYVFDLAVAIINRRAERRERIENIRW